MSLNDPSLDPNDANFTSLTPLSFLVRAAKVYPDKVAVIYGQTRYTYAQFYQRCRRLADALRQRGIGMGDTVAVMAPNIPPLLEAHYGVPMAGAVLNALNTRLDARSLRTFLAHGEAKVLIVDREFLPLVANAVTDDTRVLLIEIDDGGVRVPSLGGVEYEDFLRQGDPQAAWSMPSDEWEPIALNYTSGTSGDPRGVVYHHRGAYLNAISNAMLFLNAQPVYLWTLPMFHCNGWTFTWAVTLVAGTHVCLRGIDPMAIYQAIDMHHVTHMCAAPIVLNLLIQPYTALPHRIIEVATGGAAPPAAVIERAEQRGLRVTHLYGLTESFGPSAICAWQEGWDDLPIAKRAALMARQGVPNMVPTAIRVVDKTMQDVPADGQTLGEMVLRGNSVMAGYLKAPEATEAAFRGGWFHTGDLAVMHPDGYVEIKDRSKDIILVGGDNISSLEIEEALYRHAAVLEAAVVAKDDPIWGEVPVAFVTFKPPPEPPVSAEEIINWCQDNLAAYKVPRQVIFGPLPKTATGKIQKFELRELLKRTAVI